MIKFLDYDGLETLVNQIKSFIANGNYTKTEVDEKLTVIEKRIEALGAVFNLKETVATKDLLPAEGNEVGDVRHVTENAAEYVWDGTSWEELGTTIDLTPYLKRTDADILYATAAQGKKADTAIQPTDLLAITNDEIDNLFA